jgi:hypothetical protein
MRKVLFLFSIIAFVEGSCHKNSKVENDVVVKPKDIYYKDFIPDLVITPTVNSTEGYPVKLNADTLTDMTVHATLTEYYVGHTSYIKKVWIECQDSLVFIKPPKGPYWYSCDSALALNTIINDTNETTSSIMLYFSDTGLGIYEGCFDAPGFVGLKFKNGDNWYYGWMRIRSHSFYDTPFSIYDVAINNTPKEPIAMGEH